MSVLCCVVPVWKGNKSVYLSLPLGYRIWKKKEASKLDLAASLMRQVMPSLSGVKNVILLCDSWYAKKNLVRMVDEYENLDIICNARNDSVIYDLAPPKSGKRGRPPKHGKRLSIKDDFSFSEEKIGDYYIGVRRVLSNIFGEREVLALLLLQEIQAVAEGFSSVQFFRNSSPCSVHGRKKLLSIRQAVNE